MLLVVALLSATAVAFGVTQRLKLERGPIAGPEIDKVFSPVCGCAKRRARIEFRLRQPATLTIGIVDEDGDHVRTLIRERPYPAGPVAAVWNGRDADGGLVTDGSYRPRIELGRREIVMPNRIEVDTRAPRIAITKVSRAVFSPDGDGRFDSITVRYRQSEPATPSLVVNGRPFETKRSALPTGEFRWYGRRAGRALPPGSYALSLRTEDLAGNRSRRTDPARVRIRYVELARSTVRVRAGFRFGIGVHADAGAVSWRLGRRRGIVRPGLLVLRAPSRPGRYTLTVSTHRHSDRARVLVAAG
jgi:hypothetical protein